jgi:glycosyltransferase involved in cell wall biosynthesis
MEAMLFGVPILTSDLDFAHAVCRDAALYFDPWDLNSIRDAILTLKNDPGLAQRLVTSGKAVLERTDMNWDEIAAAVLARVACVVDSKQQEANA